MPFSDSIDKVTITKGVLTAQCKKADNKTYVQSSIPLNDYIGNDDGKLSWGGRGFSHTAEAVQYLKGVLTAKIKNSAGKVIESKLDLNPYIQNVDGVLGLIPQPTVVDVKKVDGVKLYAPDLTRGESNTSTTSASAIFSNASATSESTATYGSASSIQKSYSASSYFSSSKFRTSSKHLLFEDTCSNLELKGTHLHADCKKLDDSIQHSYIDLNECLGFIDGGLEWDLKGFKDHCFEYALDGCFLVCKYYHPEGKYQHEGKHYHICRIDLRTRLCNSDGILIIIELNKKLSVLLSEVPWMKFKVIAEPDLNIFARHPVIKDILIDISETAVEHVTREMHKAVTIALEAAIVAINASAREHVAIEIRRLVEDAVGYASASASITAAECLHLYGPPRHVYGRGKHLHGEGGHVYGEGAHGYGGDAQVYGEGGYGGDAHVYGGRAPGYGGGVYVPSTPGYEGGQGGYSNGRHHEEHRVYTDNRYAETAKDT